MSQRVRFVAEVNDGLFTMTELCDRYHISRRTGYKWLKRAGELADRSRRPHHCPTAVSAAIVTRIRDLRQAYGWGPRKLRALLLKEKHPVVPARSTVALILRREGLIAPRRRRARAQPGAAPESRMQEPNAVWTADYKGQFRTADGAWCYPLTVMDGFSRYLLACATVAGPRTEESQRVFTRVFRAYGLPRVIRTDNGEPFASPTTIGRLSRLAVWWIRLGIEVERIEPGRPDQNGRHERFHRTLDETRRGGPAADVEAQQRRFRHHRQIYNEVRPHEALEDQTPAALYTPSPRVFPRRLPEIDYPAAHLVRQILPSGTFRWHGHHVYLTRVLVGERIGLLPTTDGLWTVYFGSYRVGQFNERTRRVSGAD